MVEIKLTNSMSRAKEVFSPLDPDNVRMYVCGPTVYDRAHLGNARPVVVFDVLYRLLRHVYGAEHVTYVRNFTDVDDKINARAARDGRGIREITDETIGWYHADMEALGALRPNREPRATEYIPQMIDMISELIGSGHAYAAEGHVLFAVDSYDGYGRLSGRAVEDMIAGARVEVAPYKRNPMDFVLWKPSDEGLPGWESPWGRGRPGWHIECSAMSRELLGVSFDIHCGGNDLMFPHHENEIAQSCCSAPDGGFAKVWLHNEMLQVEGKKMSKSLGNFFTVRDLLEKGVPGEVIRAAFLLSHYRDVMDFGVSRRHEAASLVTDFAKALGRDGSATLREIGGGVPLPEVAEAIADDLNTPKAIRLLREALKSIPHAPEVRAKFIRDIYASQILLGFDLAGTMTALDAAVQTDERRGVIIKAIEAVDDVSTFARRIEAARSAKDYAEADRLRDALVAAGVEVRITKEGVEATRLPGFDPAKLEGLA